MRKTLLALIGCLMWSASGSGETAQLRLPSSPPLPAFIGVPRPERTAQAVTDTPAPPTSAQYAPGWVVELRTFSVPEGRLTPDPGNVAAYTEPGPVFTEEIFVKESGLAKGRQPIVGGASSKFVAHDPGTYQLGVRIEVRTGRTACYETLSLNGTVLSQRRVDSPTPIVAISPVELVPGLYDATLIFGCEAGNFQTTSGKLTILVAHPDELAPVPARPGDFVRPVKSRYRVPDSNEPKSVPTFTPTDRLPSTR